MTPQTAPEAPQRPDIRPPGVGACTCPPGTLYDACTCQWGNAITRMLQLGYAADPLTIAREAPALGTHLVRDVMPSARYRALRALRWAGPVGELAKLLGVTQRALRNFAPTIVADITDRRGTTGRRKPQ